MSFSTASPNGRRSHVPGFVKRQLDKITVENIKLELMRTAYGEQQSFLARRDPRILIAWYLVFAIVPWFFYNRVVLLLLLAITVAAAAVTRVSKLIIILLIFGVVSQLGSLAFVALFLGGDFSVFLGLSTLVIKLVTVSLASIAVFACMDPERFSDGLLSLRVPGHVTFGISYAYRIVPVLIEEYNNIINAYRLRGRRPERRGFLGMRQLFYIGRLAIKAFYPMALNTAKRVRTTVEGLEVKGFTYSLHSPEARAMKLAHLRVTVTDVVFLLASVALVAASIALGEIYTL
jgi:energy-coupling factor transport system permease protein